MSGDGWESMSHAEIVAKLSALQPDGAFNAAQKWSDIYTKVSDAAEHYRSADTKISQIWTGEGPDAARMTFRDKYTELQSDEGIPAKAGKLQNALFQDGACLTNAGYVPQAYPVPPDSTDKDAKQKLLEAVRAEAQRLYTEPLDVTRPEVDPTQQGSQTSPLPQNQPGSGGGGGGNSGGGGSDSKPQSPGGGTDGLADKNTKPQLANGDGQGGQGQGAGSGSGSGAGGGQGAGSGKAGKGKGLAPDPAAVLAAAKAPAPVRVQAVVHRLAPDPERAQAVPASRWGRPLRQVTDHPDRLEAPASLRAQPAVQARCAPAEDFRAGPPAAQVPTPPPSARPAYAGEPWDLWASWAARARTVRAVPAKMMTSMRRRPS